MEEIELKAQQQEEANKKYYNKLLLIKKLIIAVYVIVLFVIIYITDFYLIPYNPWFNDLKLFTISSTCFFLISWSLSFPLRVIFYKICTKQGTLNQNFKSWVFDWIKNLITELIIYVPFFSISLTILYYCNYNRPDLFIPALIVFFILILIVSNLRKMIALCFIHGIFKLQNGEHYNYWKSITQKQNLKLFPIFVLKIKEKAKWANALAFGTKKFGFILTSDLLLEKLTEKDFSAILAHETGHLLNNDHPKRFIPFLCIAFLGCIFFFLSEIINNTETFILLIALIASIITILISSTAYYQKQEYNADQFSKYIIGEGESLASALTYIYDINKIPKEPKKLFGKNVGCHPSLNDRIKNLLNNTKPESTKTIGEITQEENHNSIQNNINITENEELKKEKEFINDEEFERQRFFNKIDSSFSQSGMISFALFFVALGFVYVFNIYDHHLILRILINSVIFIAYFITGAVLGYPVSFSIYEEAKKRDLIRQNQEEWKKEYIIAYLIQIFIFVPVLGIGVSFIIQYFSNNIYEFISVFIVFLGIIFLSIQFAKLICLFMFNKIYLLRNNKKLEYWKSITEKSNIKFYPVFIINTREKIICANAVAFGVKNFGLIITNDIVLENTTKEQFAAIMAHETGHIEYALNIINLLFLTVLVFSTLCLCIYSFIFSFTDDNVFVLLLSIIIIMFIYLLFRRNYSPASIEFEADLFSKKIMKSGKPLAEALKYLHDVNKTPNKTKIGSHPSLEKRIERLLEGEFE